MNKDADDGVLNNLAHSTANTRKIEQHWDDMMVTADSLTLGKIRVPVAIHSLLSNYRLSGLMQAIIEVGKINNSLYLCNYTEDEDFRRRTQLRAPGKKAGTPSSAP